MHLPMIIRSLRSLLFVVVAVGLFATACSSSDPVRDAAATGRSDDLASESTEPNVTVNDVTGDEAVTSPGPVTEQDLARFVAATEAALAGTSIEGVVLEGPEIYIGVAQASCARFTQGDSFEQIVSDYLADTEATPGSDDEQLIGAILGAAVETICPEHAANV